MTLLNTREVAEQLGVSVVRVRQMIREGKIEAHNLGRDYAIRKDALADVVVYRKPGRPPLTDEERAARAQKRTAEKGVQALLFEPPATRPKPARKVRAKKAGTDKKLIALAEAQTKTDEQMRRTDELFRLLLEHNGSTAKPEAKVKKGKKSGKKGSAK